MLLFYTSPKVYTIIGMVSHRRPEDLPPLFKALNRFRKALGIGVDHIEWGCGSNENADRLIRRWFQKGTDFSKVTAAQIAALQDWINNYPRKVLN